MGGGAVRLPPDLAIEGLDRIEAATEREVEPWVLRFSMDGSMGELQFYE
jgi:hypothetical protein